MEHPIALEATAAARALEPQIPILPEPAPLAPVDAAERITALDILRGFALLGILLMNIVAMGLFIGAYDNPAVAGGAAGPNLAVWAVLHVLAEGKMRCLFSLVFGASIILLTSRLEKRGDAADIYYRRTLWLLLFGIVHAYLFWLGDILYPYALCALVLYPFRRMAPKRLFTIGGALVGLTAVAYVGMSFSHKDMLEKGRSAMAAEATGQKLTAEQKDAKDSYEKWRKFNRPTQAELAKDAAEWRGNPISVIKARAKFVGFFHSKPYYNPMNWDIWSMMFIGMGLFKIGVLSAEKSGATYAKMALLGFGIGIPVNSFTAYKVIQSNFDPVVQAAAHATYDIGRLSIALGYLGLVMLLCKTGSIGFLTSRLGAVGQMAFSNYILQSVITAFIFTGYGLKLYGTMERHQLYYVVLGIWVVNLVVSPIWLKHYRFGPLEWGWRSLTYWKKQPMRRLKATAVHA